MIFSETPPHWLFVAREGVRLACADYGGSGDPALVLHDLCGHADDWLETAEWLAESHRVFVPDARAHGRSERRPDDISLAAHVEDAAFWVESLCQGPAIVVGRGLGGHAAALLAARRPDLVKALVVLDATPDGSPRSPQEIARRVEGWPVPFASREAALEFFGGDTPVARAWADRLEELEDGLGPRFEADVMVASQAELSDCSYWDEWGSIECPTLVVRTEDGVPLDTCVRMIGQPRSSTAVEIPGAADLPHLQELGPWHAALEAFLQQQRAGASHSVA